MTFTPIYNLKLKFAFEDSQKFQDIVTEQDYLKELFEWTDRGIVFIHDDTLVSHSTFITDTSGLGRDKTFKVENIHHQDLFLWHIDGVLYNKNSKCDCAFLTEEHIGFVEFKSNATNNTDSSIKENYEKAKSQLCNTFKDVAERCNKIGVDITKVIKVEAFAVFNQTVPRNNAYQKKVAAKFLLETNGVPLYFKNSTKV